jgi:hypothetical protein
VVEIAFEDEAEKGFGGVDDESDKIRNGFDMIDTERKKREDESNQCDDGT